jgi:predicted transcriptional regulator
MSLVLVTSLIMERMISLSSVLTRYEGALLELFRAQVVDDLEELARVVHLSNEL